MNDKPKHGPANGTERLWYEIGRAEAYAEQARSLLLPEPPPTIWERLDNFIKKLATKTK